MKSINDELLRKNANLRRYADLLDSIPDGSENAISMERLAQYLGISTRDLRKVVLTARQSGLIICSSNDGYFIPVELVEVERYFRRVNTKLRSCSIALHPVRRLLKERSVCK